MSRNAVIRYGRYRCRVCGRSVIALDREKHNLKHAKEQGLIVHCSFNSRPICGAKTSPHTNLGIYLVTGKDGEFNCRNCRKALDAWVRNEPDRHKEVMRNLKKALESAAHKKRIANVQKAKDALSSAKRKVGTYDEVVSLVAAAEAHLTKARSALDRYDPCYDVESGIEGLGPLRSRKKKHRRPGK